MAINVIVVGDPALDHMVISFLPNVFKRENFRRIQKFGLRAPREQASAGRGAADRKTAHDQGHTDDLVDRQADALPMNYPGACLPTIKRTLRESANNHSRTQAPGSWGSDKRASSPPSSRASSSRVPPNLRAIASTTESPRP